MKIDKSKIFRLTLDNLGHYEIRFLPNVNDFQNPYMMFKSHFNTMHHRWVHRYIAYAMVNGETKVFIFSEFIKRLFKSDEILGMLKISESGLYASINTVEDQDLVRTNGEVKKNKKYIFNPNGNATQMIEELWGGVKHINLETVLYQELNKKAHLMVDKGMKEFGYKPYPILDEYKKSHPGFEAQYKLYLRTQKINKLINNLK